MSVRGQSGAQSGTVAKPKGNFVYQARPNSYIKASETLHEVDMNSLCEQVVQRKQIDWSVKVFDS